MPPWQILTLLGVSLSISTASNLPLLNTSTLLKGISDVPHFILFFRGETIISYDDERSVVYGK